MTESCLAFVFLWSKRNCNNYVEKHWDKLLNSVVYYIQGRKEKNIWTHAARQTQQKVSNCSLFLIKDSLCLFSRLNCLHKLCVTASLPGRRIAIVAADALPFVMSRIARILTFSLVSRVREPLGGRQIWWFQPCKYRIKGVATLKIKKKN